MSLYDLNLMCEINKTQIDFCKEQNIYNTNTKNGLIKLSMCVDKITDYILEKKKIVSYYAYASVALYAMHTVAIVYLFFKR